MTQEPTAPRDAAAAFEQMGRLFHDAVEAQGQAVNRAQGWSTDIMAAYREQVEEYNALLKGVNRSLRAMEELVESQTKATKAMSESLDASRELVNTAVAANQRSLDRVESLLASMVQQSTRQLEVLSSQMQASQSMVPGPLAAQNAAYLALAREWTDAFNNFLSGTRADEGSSGAEDGR